MKFRSLWMACWIFVAWQFTAGALPAQESLPFDETEAFQKYTAMTARRGELAETGGRASKIRWSADGRTVYFTAAEKRFSLNIDTGERTEIASDPETRESLANPSRADARPRVARAKQREQEPSPDGAWMAVYRDFNVWIQPAEGKEGAAVQVTSDGNERHRYGTCCWVYGEELDQNEAMWWSGDGQRLVFYEVDESGMRDYWLTLDNTKPYTTVEATRYPKAGDPNPVVGLMVFDRPSGTLKRLEIPGEERQYLFNIRFAPDGKTLLVNRTGRRQDVLDVLAVDLDSGSVRTLVTERQETWQENAPSMRFLADGERFIWESEATGWRHFQLRHLDGRLLNELTDSSAAWPCEGIELVDEDAGWIYYMANSDANPYNAQLHRARLDGTAHQRISDSPLHHSSVQIGPGHHFAVAVREAVDTPHETVVYDCQTGREVAVLARGSRAACEAAGLAPPELFSFLADDGKTTVWGYLHKPAHFDPSKKYPLLIDVYGGPASRGLTNTWNPANPRCELGMVVAKIGNRGTTGRGKAFESATYLRLGEADIADQAAAVRLLLERPWIDGRRVGIYGHSYGGYMSALALLKYPDLFQVGVAGAPVTDWRNYDTIYTERYMRTPQENPEGYEQGSCMPLAGRLKGRLVLVHGLIDDNVHPANSWQLAEKLQAERKYFDMMIYPGFQHGIGSNYGRYVMEYLYRHLVLVQ